MAGELSAAAVRTEAAQRSAKGNATAWFLIAPTCLALFVLFVVPIAYVLLLLVGGLVLFSKEVLPVDVSAIILLLLLVLPPADILTPGDQPSVLVAMNPAALRVNLGDLAKGGTVIVNTDAFNERNLQKAR